MVELTSEAIYESELGDDREFARAIRVCLMGTTRFPAVTFQPQSTSEDQFLEDWKSWHKRVFMKCLAPHLVRCHQAICVNQVDEVIEADCALDQVLGEATDGEDALDRSASAGSVLYGTIDGARHVQQIVRFRKAVMEQQIPGHFATVLAVEAALFHVPLMHVLPACLFAEWRGGLANESSPSIGQFIEAAAEEIRESRKIVQASLAGSGRLVVCA